MSKRKVPAPPLDQAYAHIREILSQARNQAYQAINSAMVQAYWEIGRVIVQEEQRGSSRADYGKRIINDLSKRLTIEFGKGFDRSNLFHMRAFFLAYPKVDALRRQLSWTHYRILLRVEKPEARSFYEAEAINGKSKIGDKNRKIENRGHYWFFCERTSNVPDFQ